MNQGNIGGSEPCSAVVTPGRTRVVPAVLAVIVVCIVGGIAWWERLVTFQIRDGGQVLEIARLVAWHEGPGGEPPSPETLQASSARPLIDSRGAPISYRTFRATGGPHWIAVAVGRDGKLDMPLEDHLADCLRGRPADANTMGHWSRDTVVVDGETCRFPMK